MTFKRALKIDRTRSSNDGVFWPILEQPPKRRQQDKRDALERWRRYMLTVLDAAVEQCERRNQTAPATMSASDVSPSCLVSALIEQLQVRHNLEVRSPSNNQDALAILFALQPLYSPHADEGAPEPKRRRATGGDHAEGN